VATGPTVNKNQYNAELDSQRALLAAIRSATSDIEAAYAAGDINMAGRDAALADITSIGATAQNPSAAIGYVQAIALAAQRETIESSNRRILTDMIEHDAEVIEEEYARIYDQLTLNRQLALEEISKLADIAKERALTEEERIRLIENAIPMPTDGLTEQDMLFNRNTVAAALEVKDANGVSGGDALEAELSKNPNSFKLAVAESSLRDQKLEHIANDNTVSQAKRDAARKARQFNLQINPDSKDLEADVQCSYLGFCRNASAYKAEIIAVIGDKFSPALAERIQDKDVQSVLDRAADIYQDSARHKRTKEALGAGLVNDDTAALSFAAVVVARVSMDTLVARSQELANGKDNSVLLDKNAPMKDRAAELIAHIIETNPQLKGVDAAKLNSMAMQTLAAYDANPDAMNTVSARRQQADRIAQKVVDDDVAKASANLRKAEQAGKSNSSWLGDTYDRNILGMSFVEREFRDVKSIMHQAAKNGGLDKSILKMNENDMINYLSDTGFIERWDENNRIHILTQDGEKFTEWNDRSRDRIDTDHDGQIDGLEALDALRIADFVKNNPNAHRKIEAAVQGLGSVTPGKGISEHDINRDGTIDAYEVIRVMHNNGLSLDEVDSTAELKQILPNMLSAADLGR
jgi:hypothetical protein